MIVYFANHLSQDMFTKFRVLMDIKKDVADFFERKCYGTDIEVLYIGVFCLNPIFESAFPHKKPQYDRIGKILPNGDRTEDKALNCELRLDYKKYHESIDIRQLIVQDTLRSLDIIKTMTQLKDFDLVKFKADFEDFFMSIGWH
jgi:hypothetical protein